MHLTLLLLVLGAAAEPPRLDPSLLLEAVDTDADLDVGIIVATAPGNQPAEGQALALQASLREALAADPDVAATRVVQRRDALAGRQPRELARLATGEGCNAVLVAVLEADGSVAVDVFDGGAIPVSAARLPAIPQVVSRTLDEKQALRQFERDALVPYILTIGSGITDSTYPIILDHAGNLVADEVIDALPKRPEGEAAFAKMQRLNVIGRMLAGSALVLAIGSWIVPFIGPLLAFPIYGGLMVGLLITRFMRPTLDAHYVTMTHDYNVELALKLGLKPADLPRRYFPLSDGRGD